MMNSFQSSQKRMGSFFIWAMKPTELFLFFSLLWDRCMKTISARSLFISGMFFSQSKPDSDPADVPEREGYKINTSERMEMCPCELRPLRRRDKCTILQ